MTTNGVDEAVEALRRAGLAPTQQRMTIAALVFSGPTVALTADDLCDRALDDGICLTRDWAEQSLDEFRQAGILPRSFHVAPPPPLNLSRAARLLQAMGNPHRLKVLRELTEGERCAGDLGQAVGLQPSALSQHLARLRADGLVQQRRAASRIYYSLAGHEATAVLRSLAA